MPLHKGKNDLHTAVQHQLKNILGEEASLEHPFPSISRIADCYWPPHSLIFEVQISPIHRREVEARNRDYTSLGLQVVWIFHEKRFNRRRLTPVERTLNSPYYYTDINAGGEGTFYDQVRLIRNRRVIKRFPKLPISLEKPLEDLLSRLPPLLHHRSTALYFSGDALDTLCSNPEAWQLPKPKHPRRNPYRWLLDFVLSRCVE